MHRITYQITYPWMKFRQKKSFIDFAIFNPDEFRYQPMQLRHTNYTDLNSRVNGWKIRWAMQLVRILKFEKN